MSKIANTIAAVTVATATTIGGVIYVNSENNINENDTLDNYQKELSVINIPSIEIPSIQIPNLQIPNIENFSKNFKVFQQLVVDQRNFDHSKHLYIDKWVDIYKKYQNVDPIQYIPLNINLRMISQVCVYKTLQQRNNLIKNLKFYKSKGYNSALLVFKTNDNVQDLINIARLIKQNNMYVFFAFGDSENLNKDIFCNPQWFENVLTNLAKECHGYMPWRRSSLHLFIPDKAYNNYVHHTLRKANPNIYIMGEIYYGMTAINHPKIDWFSNIPTNCSGIMLKNFGYKGFNLENIIKITRKKYNTNDLPIMGVVVGDKPYYATRRKNNLDFEKNFQIKVQLEKRFMKSKIIGTITMHDDGSNGIYDSNITNNLTQSVFN